MKKLKFVLVLNTFLVLILIFIVLMFLYQNFIKPNDCKLSITTASGFAASREICAGNLIFDENFDTLDKLVWRPELTLGGGGVSDKLLKAKNSQENWKIIFFFVLEHRMESFNGMLMTGKMHLLNMGNCI